MGNPNQPGGDGDVEPNHDRHRDLRQALPIWAIVSNLSVSVPTVSFTNSGGWATPTNQAVTVMSNQTTTATGTYVQQFGNLGMHIVPFGPRGCGFWSLVTKSA